MSHLKTTGSRPQTAKPNGRPVVRRAVATATAAVVSTGHKQAVQALATFLAERGLASTGDAVADAKTYIVRLETEVYEARLGIKPKLDGRTVPILYKGRPLITDEEAAALPPLPPEPGWADEDSKPGKGSASTTRTQQVAE